MTEDPFLGVDNILHQTARIKIMSRLIVLHRARFGALRKLTGLSAGNLASHLLALETAGYVELGHALLERRLGKYAQITPSGDSAFREYVTRLQGVLEQIRTSLPTLPKPIEQD